jgi:ABC-2 type transport system permease protein
MVSEEADGLAETILATAVTRLQWILSHITCFVLGTLAILLALGFGAAVVSIIEPDIRVLKLLEAAMIQAPAILVLAGLSIMIFGLAPRWSGTLAWAALVISMLAGPFFGPALDLPQWAQNISPFTHTPFPTETITATPIIVLLLIAAVLSAGGLISFSRRSIQT